MTIEERLEYLKKKKNEPQQKSGILTMDEKIAKKEAERASKSSGFLKKGAWEDGYQVGDYVKTVGSSGADLILNVGKGIGNLGEGITDLGLYATSGIAGLLGADEFARDTKNLAKKNSVNDALSGIERAVDKNSILGNTSDSIAQGLGYVGGMALTAGAGGAVGLGRAGISALQTGVTFASSMGSGMGEAYQGDASDQEAATYGAIKGTGDAITELLSSGLGKAAGALGFSKGISGLDDILAQKVSSKFSNQIAKNLMQYGIKAGAEGTEEVLAGIVSAIGKKATYMSEEDTLQLLKDENLFEQFVTGAVVSAVAQAPSLHTSNKTGRDFVTGLNKNEEAVIDAIAKERIEELESAGKVSAKKRSKIRQEIEAEMDKGYLDIEKLESILGGESYDAYKRAADSFEEYQKLNRMKGGELTGEQSDRLAELKEQVQSGKLSQEQVNDLKNKMSQVVRDITADDRLAESYHEKGRRQVAYQADLSKYDKGQQAVIQKAIDSKILNNTNRTHEFVDMIAKLSADRGVSFDFTNNQRLKESGLALNGKTVNGYIQDGNITLNINSAKALNKVVGHEITHVLEGTELYTELQNTIIEYAKAKGDYDARWESIVQLYRKQFEGQENEARMAQYKAELTADLVGDYLFSDTDFVNKLSAEKPSIFKKIFDEIKYLCKVATAGSKEAKELEKVKRAFEKAYKENANFDSKIKLSTSEVIDLSMDTELAKKVGGLYGAEKYKKIQEYILEVLGNQPINLSDGKQAIVDRSDALHIANKAATKKTAQIARIKELVENAEIYAEDKNVEHNKFNYFCYYKADVRFGEEVFPIYLNVGKSINDGKYHIYDITNKIRDTADRINGLERPKPNEGYALTNVISNNIISDEQKNATSTYSLSEDSQGRTLSNEQIEYFKDSKVRDENGALKPVYHGTNAEFSVFKSKDGTYWFSESVDYAEAMMEEKSGNRIIEAYVNIRNPYITKMPEHQFSDPVEERAIIKYAKENGYDGIIIENDTDSEYAKETFYVAFDSSQIKSIDNTNPTSNPDINMSLSHTNDDLPIRSDINRNDTYGSDIELDIPIRDDIAPVQERVSQYVDSYSDHQKNNWKNSKKIVLYESETQLKQFVEDAKERKNAGKKLYFGKIQDEVAKRIESELGYDVNGYNCALYSDNVKKIFKDHGDEAKENQRGQRAVEVNDFVRIPEVVATATEIESGGDYNGQPVIHFKKDGITVVGVITEGALDLYPQTMYISKKNRSLATATDEQAPVYTSETTRSTASTNSISQPTKNTTKISEDLPIREDLEQQSSVLDDDIPIRDDIKNPKKTIEELKEEALAELGDRDSFMRKEADELLRELKSLGKGKRASLKLGHLLDWGYPWSELKQALANVRGKPDKTVDENSGIESIVRESMIRNYEQQLEDIVYMDLDMREVETSSEESWKEYMEQGEKEAERELSPKQREKSTRKKLHNKIIENIKKEFIERGFDFDVVLSDAKNKSTFASVDNTPQRYLEKTLGYKEGQLLSDLTVNQTALNESKAIKWLNSFTDRKTGRLVQLSKKYGIKLGSKESAAAQMYGEGFYVNEKNEYVRYGDAELAKDFPDVNVQERIKGLAKEPEIRRIYDETLDKINESRIRNAYPEIPRRKDYFLHFKAMDDYFSKLGIPFNPEKIMSKDLPTDINGVTADLKPGQPYFASANRRMGVRTSYDLLGGMERYLNSAKNQIYHIDDIQKLRALRNYVADMFGQAKGFEGLDELSQADAAERIEQIKASHLSTFAKFLNEQANTLAGKTSLIDRGVETLFGRRAINFLDTVNKQVGSNMVGMNASSAFTNLVAVIQGFAKANKYDFMKGATQLISNKLNSIKGESDGFREMNPLFIRRKGIEKLTRTPYEKIKDVGYVLAGAIDEVSTELLLRAKYNELTRKGMDEYKAHIEADKWASRILGDRSYGQQPHLYNSKVLGLITKFQLEVRNQLDSMFYDTIQEAKLSTEEIQNEVERNSKKAARITSVMVQLAVGQHLFGAAFEAIAGYNPTFDLIEIAIKLLGLDDDEESEDTPLDNLEQAFLALVEDMPYTSTFTGGRVPIASALPIEELITGVDEYGNEKNRLETIAEALPYYLLPTGYGQIKKTYQGLSMFDDDLPIAGSYTKNGLIDKIAGNDPGKLRFSVDDTMWNRAQAAVFGQYATPQAKQYFDEERLPLDEKKTQELADLDLPIADYWKYRDGLKGLDALSEKADYIASLDLPISKKNIMVNNQTDRKEPIDLTDYDIYGDFETMDYAQQTPEKYAIAQAFDGTVKVFKAHSKELNKLEADKDKNGEAIEGSLKSKKVDYINSLDLEYGEKIILYKSQYPGDDTYNYDIVEYLNGRDDLSYAEIVEILEALGMKVDASGKVRW